MAVDGSGRWRIGGGDSRKAEALKAATLECGPVEQAAPRTGHARKQRIFHIHEPILAEGG